MPHKISPTVSVIIPAYNCSQWIGRAIDSVLTQSFTQLEIIVVDDGSTDNLDAALDRYRRQICLLRQKNSGAAAARNRGASAAGGDLLAFLDADDCWHPRKLEYQLEAYRRWPAAGLCSTGCLTFAEYPPSYAHLEPPAPDSVLIEGPDFETFFASPYLGTPSVMMKRSVFVELKGFREDLRSAEDVDLWLRACFDRSTARVDFPMTYIVPSPQSLTTRQGAAVFENNLKVIDDFCRTHPQFLRDSVSSVRRARAKVLENWASGELVEGNRQAATRLAFRSIRNRFSWRAAYLMCKAQLGV